MKKKSPPRKKKSEPHRFNAFICRGSVDHFGVVIHDTQLDLLIEKTGGINTAIAYFEGDTHSHTIRIEDGKEVTFRNPHIGDLYFNWDQISIATVAHEVFHAVCYWAKCCGMDAEFAKPKWIERFTNEEIMAEAIGCVVNQIFKEIADNLKIVTKQKGVKAVTLTNFICPNYF